MSKLLHFSKEYIVLVFVFLFSIHAHALTETEPNGTLATANITYEDSVMSGTIGGLDVNDYFLTIPADDGSIKFDFTFSTLVTTNDFFFYVYNKSGGLKGTRYVYNPGIGTLVDSLTIFCVKQDTIYIRVASSGVFNYSISYNTTPSGVSDFEPNNTLNTANYFAPTDTVKGRINYTSVASDNEDYFYSVLPDDGTLKYIVEYNNTSGNNSADFFSYIYNKNGGLIGTSYKYNQPTGISTDTITIHCRQADTVYFRINSSGCFSYNFNYHVISTGQADIEPNNIWAEATPIQLDNTLNGRVGGRSVNVDVNDYYKFYLPEYSSVHVIMNNTNTSGSASSDIFYYLYNSAQNQVWSKYLYNQPLGVNIDTVSIHCLPADTFRLRINSNGCFSYHVEFEVENQQPVAEIETFRVGNTFAFTANTKTADAFTWDFGDGTSSTHRFPKKEYPIGTYDVTLSATNTSCNLTDVDSFFVEVKGVEYFTPTFAGAGGDAMMQIFGGGLDTNTKVTLKRGNLELHATAKYGSPGRNELQVLMDLHFADEGFYDVIIEIPGEPAVTFANGFEVTAFEYPFTYSEITGPDRWRINRDTRFVLSIGNRGNVKATGVIAFLVWPKSVDVTFDTEWFRPPDTGSYRIEVEDTAFTWQWAHIQAFYDSTYALPTPIDSFAGEAYDGYMKLIWIQNVSPDFTYDLPFIARSSSAGSPEFITYTTKPNMFGSCGNGSQKSMSENLAVQGINAIDMGLGLAKMDKTPIGWLAKATKATTTHMANLGQVMGATYNYATGTTNSIAESLPADFSANVDAGNTQIASEVLGLGTDKLVDAGATNFMKGQTNKLNRWMANNPDASISSFNFAIDNLNDINDIRQYIRDAYKTGKDLKSLNDKLTELQKLVKDCPELEKQLETLKKEIDKELHQREKKKKKTKTVVSMDPNAIYGPTGVGEEQYVNHLDRHNFLVTFENVDTATADAQVVTIKVPLDTLAFDLNSFSFGDIAIGSTSYRVPKGRNEFTLDIDMMVTRGMFVRVHAKLYKDLGIVKWEYISLDTATGTFPPLDGFLPPNVNAPEGEGSVTFSVSPKPNIANGYQVISQAEIVFDENASIFTENWSNIIDKNPSSSMITATVEGDSIFIDFNGNDAHSGVGYYYLYVSQDQGTSWNSLTGSADNTLRLLGEQGISYSFYSLSRDNVGNQETKTPTVEATVTLLPIESKFNPSFNLYPNPLGGQKLYVISNGNFTDVEVNIFDVLGRRVFAKTASFYTTRDTEMSLPPLASGTYSVHFKNQAGVITVEKLVIAK